MTPLVVTASALGSYGEASGPHDLVTLVGNVDANEEPQTTPGNWSERQAFLRKQRDLLVQMRHRKREQIFSLKTNDPDKIAMTHPSGKPVSSWRTEIQFAKGRTEQYRPYLLHTKIFQENKFELIVCIGLDMSPASPPSQWV
ncbi:hypothetical protein AHF37_10666 [Paragonimus kellicotti]|nr:hypothetical protein AHF37_10666 [Paragonimus kellicotti]